MQLLLTALSLWPACTLRQIVKTKKLKNDLVAEIIANAHVAMIYDNFHHAIARVM
jgi:hypothetical protein